MVKYSRYYNTTYVHLMVSAIWVKMNVEIGSIRQSAFSLINWYKHFEEVALYALRVAQEMVGYKFSWYPARYVPRALPTRPHLRGVRRDSYERTYAAKYEHLQLVAPIRELPRRER